MVRIIKLKISKRILRYMKDIIRKLKEQKFITKVDVSEDDYKDDITQTGDQDEIIKYVESKYEPERPEYPITKESNSALMYIMHKSDLAASEDFMTWDEVETVTKDNIAPQFSSSYGGGSGMYSIFKIYEDSDNSLVNFDEFKYFTNISELVEGVFFWCLSLESISLPKNINSIDDHWLVDYNNLRGHNNLLKIDVDKDNTVYDSRENCNAVIETSSNTLVAGCNHTIIPDSVTSIGNGAFSRCDKLTTITIPDSVTSIGYSCFRGCDELTTIKILAKTAPSIMSDSFDSGVTIKVPKGATGYDTSNWSNYTIEYMNE